MEENKYGEADIPPSSASREPRRNYRDAVVGRSFTDRASLLLLEQLASTTTVARSVLSSGEIFSRKQRAAQGSLTAEECAEKVRLLQGLTPIAQWRSAQWALFSKAKLADIGNTRYRDTSARFINTVFLLSKWRTLSLISSRRKTAFSAIVHIWSVHFVKLGRRLWVVRRRWKCPETSLPRLYYLN
jgi:hypothetical protein